MAAGRARAAAITLVLAAGCGIETSGLGGNDRLDAGPTFDAARDGGPTAGDAAVDAPPTLSDGGPIAPDAGLCGFPYVPRWLDPCALPATVDTIVLPAGDYEYDTDDAELFGPGGSSMRPASAEIDGVRVVFVEALTIEDGAYLRVIGDLPLAIAARGDITINGTIDVSSFAVGSDEVDDGAGSEVGCPGSPPDPGARCQTGASGGGGGALGARGGNGGRGSSNDRCPDDGATDGIAGGRGGEPITDVPLAPRGGCAGADGATAESDQDRALGGEGGGAVALTAAQAITVSGTIHAGGAGGEGAWEVKGGGGGGGSGGMIALEASRITLTADAILAANGGGGGGGADNRPERVTRGDDGAADSAAAVGGMGEGMATPGGRGGYAGDPAGGHADASPRGGGGGGGGSVGLVVLVAHGMETVAPGAVLSPSPVRP